MHGEVNKMRWIASVIRALIAGFAGVGGACVSRYITSDVRTNALVGAVITGASIALLHWSQRIGTPPPEEPAVAAWLGRDPTLPPSVHDKNVADYDETSDIPAKRFPVRDWDQGL